MAGGGNPQQTATPAPAPAPAMPQVPAPTSTPAVPGAYPNIPAQQGVYGQAAGAYNAALQGPNIGQFFNPFTQQVTANTLGQLGQARQMAMNDIGAAATRAGAFGGSRHGVAEAQTNAAFGRQAADTLANLNMQGFNTALGAAQNQQGMLSQLAGQGFGFGQAIGQQQMGQGTMQQGLLQSLIDAARGQYAGYTGAPMQSLTAPLAALGAMPSAGGTTTETQKPGLFNYLALALGGL